MEKKTQKTQIVKKLKNSNRDKTQKPNLRQNSKVQMVTKFNNKKCDKNQKLKLWLNSKTQIVTKNVTRQNNSTCDKNSKTQIVTKLKKSNWDKTQIVTVVIVTVVTVVVVVTDFRRKKNLTPQQPIRCFRGSLLQFSRSFLIFIAPVNWPKNIHISTQISHINVILWSK